MENLSINSSCHSLNSSETKKINSLLVQSIHLTENDDKREISERRRSKRHSLNLSSTPLVVSHEQLKDIYATCIKLSAENKINKQNAFGLQLIDYMQEVLQQIREENGPNFQVASCTLDASVKIYGHRVDSVHLDAFRIAGSLGHNDKINESNVQHEDIQEKEPEAKIKKTSKGPEKRSNSKIEMNLKNISMEKIELNEETNFWNIVYARRPISTSFGQSGPDSYITNSYMTSSDFGPIVIDPLKQFLDEPTEQTKFDTIQLPNDLTSELNKFVSSKSKNIILGELDNFSFKPWNPPSKGSNLSKGFIYTLIQTDNFNVDDTNNISCDSIHSSFNAHEPELINNDHMSILAEDNEEAPEINFDILKALAPQPSEYSFFNHLPQFDAYQQNSFLKSSYMSDFLTKVKKNILLPQKKVTKSKKNVLDDDFFDDFTAEEKKRKSKLYSRKRTNIDNCQENYHLTTNEPIPDFNPNYLFLLFIKNNTSFGPEIPNHQSKTSQLDCHYQNSANETDDNFCDVEGNEFDNCEENQLNISLLPQPPVVNRLSVKYAKFAKQINTRAIKSSMWRLIERKSLQPDVHKHLAESMPKATVSSLTPQLSFVCLLHLANEKNLHLLSSENHLDVDISFDQPLA